MIVFIDNYDSFTFNLVQMFQAAGCAVGVYRNDQISLEQLQALSPAALVISPGPGAPAQAGICMPAVTLLASRIPILGVCLGHQSIAAAFGGRIIRANRIMHGKDSWIHHDGKTIYEGLPNPFKAVRYHSLIADDDGQPECLEVSAWTDRHEIMGLRHRQFNSEGVQFHPESVLTEHGASLVNNFIDLGSSLAEGATHGQSGTDTGFFSAELERKKTRPRPAGHIGENGDPLLCQPRCED